MSKADTLTNRACQTRPPATAATVPESQHHEGVLSDALPRLASQREFRYELARRFAEWERRRLPVSLMMIAWGDSDRTETGCGGATDEQLEDAMTRVLVTTIRKMDLLTRSEQGEFSILFPDTSIAGAKQAADRIRGVIASAEYALQTNGSGLTVSIGIASVVAGDSDSSLIERTKMALTECQACGGNCLRFHDGMRVVKELNAQFAFDRQFAHARRMETVGRLAAGVAHEINTPVQYVGSNVSFLEDAFSEICSLLDVYGQLLSEVESGGPSANLTQVVKDRVNSIDLALLKQEIPKAIDQSLEGIQRVSQIVRSMKEFAHPETRSKTVSDLNRIVESMVTFSAGDWKHAANVITQLDKTLPLVQVMPGEFGQVIVNLLVNSAQAISEVPDQSGEKGTITISSRCDGDQVEIRICDTGPGIPEEYRSRIFDPFFTTKSVGVGTGQGLAMAYQTIVDEHGGTIDFELGENSGTTFVIRLPIDAPGSE